MQKNHLHQRKNRLVTFLNSAMLALSLSAATTALAQEANAPRVHFSVQVERDVPKDLMFATLSIQQRGQDLAALRREVTRKLNATLAMLKKQPSLQIETQGVTNAAAYDEKGKISGWTAQGDIQLTSHDFAAMGEALSNLGSDVMITQTDFRLSKTQLNRLETELNSELLALFQQKAQQIQRNLNGKSYRIVQINLGNARSEAPMLYRAAKVYAASSNESMTLEAGKSTVSATAEGEILVE